MSNTEKNWGKALLVGLGTLAVLSGLYFVFQQSYIDGACGIAVGALIIFLSMKKKNEEVT